MKTLQKINQEGMLWVMGHIIVSVVMLLIYGITVFKGVEDKTMQTVITIMVGYWFGAMGVGKGKSKDAEK